MEEEDDVKNGDCPFTAHGLRGEQLDTMTTNAIKAHGLQHLNNEGKFLAIGHSDHDQSIYNNPQLYPQMFPWLFPYGLGGIGVSHLSDEKHKKHLLMYHDKHFQMDVNFPFVAFSHVQMKETTKQGFLLADKRKFQGIANCLISLD